jgi:hypothetical protein
MNNNMEKYINDLLILCNKYYYFDIDYIKTKYNIKKYDIWEKFYKENSHLKLLFNCYNAEILFIFIFNIDKKYIENKYNIDINTLLHNFFIDKIDYYFSDCHENYINSKTHTMHLKKKCNCFIKVKSIVNLNIDTFIFIHKTNFNFQNFDIDIISPSINSQFISSLENLKQLKNKIPNINYCINTKKIDEIIIKQNKDILLETLIENNINYIFNKSSIQQNDLLEIENKFKEISPKKIQNTKSKEILQNSENSNEDNNSESLHTSETENTQISSVKTNTKKTEHISELDILKQKENEINKKKKMLLLLKSK